MLHRCTCHSLHSTSPTRLPKQCLGTTPTNKQPALRVHLFIGDQNKLHERDLRLQCDAMQAHLRSAGWPVNVRAYIRTPYWQMTMSSRRVMRKQGSQSHRLCS